MLLTNYNFLSLSADKPVLPPRIQLPSQLSSYVKIKLQVSLPRATRPPAEEDKQFSLLPDSERGKLTDIFNPKSFLGSQV